MRTTLRVIVLLGLAASARAQLDTESIPPEGDFRVRILWLKKPLLEGDWLRTSESKDSFTNSSVHVAKEITAINPLFNLRMMRVNTRL